MPQNLQRLLFNLFLLFSNFLLFDNFQPVASGLSKFGYFSFQFDSFLTLRGEIFSSLFYLLEQKLPLCGDMWLLFFVIPSPELQKNFF